MPLGVWTAQTEVSFCPKSENKNPKTNRHRYNEEGFCIRCGAARRRRSRFSLHREVVDDWMHLTGLIQAWGLDLPPKQELLRCHRSGRIEVWKDEQWLDDEYTAFSDHQQRKIRYVCWGPTHRVICSYSSLDQVPRLHLRTRFWIRGDPEHTGLYICIRYRQARMVCRRILPDYSYGVAPEYRIKNKPWTTPSDQDSKSWVTGLLEVLASIT